MGVVYREPFTAFRFLVEVESEGAVVAAFSEFSGLQMNVDTLTFRSGADNGAVSDVFVHTRHENITLTKGVIGDNDFLDWIHSTMKHNGELPTGSDVYRNINIIALDDIGNPGVTWTLLNCCPVSYQLSPMSATQSAVLTESIEFGFGGIYRQTAEPKPRPASRMVKPGERVPVQPVARRSAQGAPGSRTAPGEPVISESATGLPRRRMNPSVPVTPRVQPHYDKTQL